MEILGNVNFYGDVEFCRIHTYVLYTMEGEDVMQLKVTTDYAIRMLKYLSSRNEVIQSKEVSEKMGIPSKYLINLGGRLKEGGLVDTHQGKYGGYTLAKPPEEIRIYDILCVMEDTIKINRCNEQEHDNGFVNDNNIIRFYMQTQEIMTRLFTSLSIADLRDGRV